MACLSTGCYTKLMTVRSFGSPSPLLSVIPTVLPLHSTSKVALHPFHHSLAKPKRSQVCFSDNKTATNNETRIEDLPTNKLTIIVTFYSINSVAEMLEAVNLVDSICTLKYRPVIVFPALANSETHQSISDTLELLGEKASRIENIEDDGILNLKEYIFIKDFHQRFIHVFGLDSAIIDVQIYGMLYLLCQIAAEGEMSSMNKARLVSFGECISTRIFAACLNKKGIKARHHDAFDIGFKTTDDAMNADVLEESYAAISHILYDYWNVDFAIPIVTGSIGKGLRSNSVTRLGRYGNVVTTTTIAKALNIRNVHVLKVGGVFDWYCEETSSLPTSNVPIRHPPITQGEKKTVPVKVKDDKDDKKDAKFTIFCKHEGTKLDADLVTLLVQSKSLVETFKQFGLLVEVDGGRCISFKFDILKARKKLAEVVVYQDFLSIFTVILFVFSGMGIPAILQALYTYKILKK